MNKICKTTGWLLLVLVLLLSMSVTAFAYTRIDVDAETSLTLKYVSGSAALAGADFRLYKVAEISETNQYTLTEDFEKYSVSLENLDSAGWLDLAATLAAYASRDGLTSAAKGVTSSAGTVTFSNLSVGLYLVVGSPITIGNYTYSPTSFLISLPSLNDEDVWEYDVTAEVKFEKDYEGGGTGTTRRTAVKVWKNGEGENQPKSVTVQLLQNSEVFSEVVLSEENNWEYTWESLPDGYNWQLVEKEVPDGYTVSVSQNGLKFTVTNAYTPDTPDTPYEPDTPDTPNTPNTPNTPDTPDTPDTPNTPDEPKLPQTGQLWWPIPLLAGCGLALFAAGWGLVFLKRKKDA